MSPNPETAEAVMVWKRWHFWAFLGFVAALAYLTYFHRYWQPPYVFWDENYHIASAQKYLHGVYFMEQHPPLGKLLIALGEKIFHPNASTDQFLGTDYGTDFPKGFSFVGYRFFSALLAWWTAPLLFLCFYLLTKRNPLLACLLSFLYIFDNALVVHLRGAMLEGPLLFFATLTLLGFLLLYQQPRGKKLLWCSILFGAAFGAALTTKVLSLLFILLIPVILWRLRPGWRRIIKFCLAAGLSFLAVYCSVWEIHFALGGTINQNLPDQGYYQASPAYKQILAQHKNGSLLAFPVELIDSLKFVKHYNAGAPRLDLCKQDENGSPFFYWPLGARSINYRWETPDGKIYRYLYLQANPVVWWSALLGLFMAAALLIGSVLFPPQRPLQQRFLLFLFFGLWLCYMIAISRITRVMYLYHYFLPLLFSFFVLAIVVGEIQSFGKRLLTEQGRILGVMALAALIFLSFQIYRPFTYYEPISDAQVERRAFFPLWELHCVNCQNQSLLVIPSKMPGA